jgi:hypothetical protein
MIALVSLLSIFLLFVFSTYQVKAEAQNQTLVVKEVKQLTFEGLNYPTSWSPMEERSYLLECKARRAISGL